MAETAAERGLEQGWARWLEVCAECGKDINPGNTVFKDKNGKLHHPVCPPNQKKMELNAHCACGATGWRGTYPFINHADICDDCL